MMTVRPRAAQRSIKMIEYPGRPRPPLYPDHPQRPDIPQRPANPGSPRPLTR